MGLRIATNVPSMVTQRNIQESSRDVARAINRLSSGQRVMSAGDDAAGLSISKKLDAEIRGMGQAQRNANDAVSFVQTAEGSLNEVSNLLVRLRELGVQAASDTIGDEERAFLSKEYEVLKGEIDRIAAVTNYNGRQLLDGSGGDLAFQVGVHAGEANKIHYNGGEANASTSALGVKGTNVASQDDAVDSLADIDQAINKVNSYRANLGALQTRLHSASNTLSIHMENFSEARSRIGDTDVAQEAAALARSSIINQAGIAVLAQANAAPTAALKLL